MVCLLYPKAISSCSCFKNGLKIQFIMSFSLIDQTGLNAFVLQVQTLRAQKALYNLLS